MKQRIDPVKRALGFSALALCVATLAGNPAGAAPPQPVTIKNTPLPIRDVDNPVRQPVSVHLEGNLPTGSGQNSCPAPLYTVPAGKILVVEYVSVWGVSADVESANISLSRPGVQSEYMFFLERRGTSQIGHPLYGVNQQTRLYFKAGEEVSYCIARDTSADDYGFRIRISGYLVNL